MERYRILFSPIRVGSVVLRNRIVMPAMGTGLAERDGSVGDRLVRYYRERASGGAGLIITENLGVDPQGKNSALMAMIDNDGRKGPLQKLVCEVHRESCMIAAQVNHAGRQTSSSITGLEVVAPSAIPCPLMKELPSELRRAEIHDLIERFARAALRAKEAGFDALEFHMAHGYLVCQFLSSFSNKRADDYGGSLENRCRFALEIVRASRELVGNEFPLICRISADEKVQGGLTLKESVQIAGKLVEAGADAIHVSACNYATFHLNMPCYYMEEGCFLSLAKQIKDAVSVPVIGVGRIWRPEQAEEALAKGFADLISMGRALIADPHLPNKTREGREEAIRPCLACNRCFESMAAGGLRCMVNPELPSARRSLPTGAPKLLRIIVIGGGPAGMEAACALRTCGHDVALFEESSELGGQIRAASVPPGKAHFTRIVQYYTARLAEVGVRVCTSVRCTAEMIERARPDLVILATGSRYTIAGIEVQPGANILTCPEALFRRDAIGTRVVVVGGGPEGAEAADTFCSMGKKVTIVEMKRRIGMGLPTSVRKHLETRLAEGGVEILTRTKVMRILRNAIDVEARGTRREIGNLDAVVIATGRVSRRELAPDLEARGLRSLVIGDALEPRGIQEAIAEGASVVSEISQRRLLGTE